MRDYVYIFNRVFLMQKIFCSVTCTWSLLGNYKSNLFFIPAILLNLLI